MGASLPTQLLKSRPAGVSLHTHTGAKTDQVSTKAMGVMVILMVRLFHVVGHHLGLGVLGSGRS